jgi:hypothetical protein
MPNKSGAELLKEWEALLNACRANERVLPEVDGLMNPLATAVVQMKVLEVVRLAMTQTAQETTNSLNEARENARESARRLRSYIRSRLGSRSEQLPQFGIVPLGARTKKQARERAV